MESAVDSNRPSNYLGQAFSSFTPSTLTCLQRNPSVFEAEEPCAQQCFIRRVQKSPCTWGTDQTFSAFPLHHMNGIWALQHFQNTPTDVHVVSTGH